MTDSDWLLSYLERHPEGVDAMQAINASLRERDTALMVHSRAADLRKRGHAITCHVEGKTRKGRDRWVYKLCEATPKELSLPPLDSSGDSPGVREAQESTPTPTPEPLTQLELV